MSGFSFEAELAKGDAVKDAEYEAWKTAKIAEIGAWRFKTVVCRHWLRNACMNGDRCEYMHEFDRDRMPECHNGQDCNKPDCPFKHSGPRGKKECLFYKQGFCVHGPNCKFNHTKYTAEALPKYGDYSTLFDGKDHERPENKSLGDLVDPKELSRGRQGDGGSGGYAQPGTSMTMMPPGANGVIVPRREFPKNINYRTSICRMFAEGFCKHADRCHFAHGEEMLRTRQQNADEFNLPFQASGGGPSSGQGIPMGGDANAAVGYHNQNSNQGGSFRQNASPPVPLLDEPKSDLLDKHGGSYRYFVVRTPDPTEQDDDPDYDNIMVSLFKGVWCTSGDRAEALSTAFRDCDHVFLFFTVGGSNLFQGCARMASKVDLVDTASGAKGPVGFGDGNLAIFTVQWLKLCELEHRAVEHLSYNGRDAAGAGSTVRYVPQAQDFEELPAQTGSAVLELMWKEDSFEVDFEDVDIDASRFEGWGAHGIADPAKGLAGDGSGIGSLLPVVEKGSERALIRDIWRVEGPGFIVGCDGEMFGECFQRSLFGMPELYKEQTRFIHKGTTLLLYRLDTKQLFGIFEAGSACMTLLEPNAFAPDNTATTLYPVQVRFRVVAEVPPMEEDEIVSLLGGGQPVRRVEPDVMQRLVDRMVETGGGATTVAMKNGLPIPGFDADPQDGKFREKLFIGDEITDDRRFRGAQRVAGPNGQNLIKIVNEVGIRALRLSLVGRGAGQSPGGEEGPDGLALIIEANDAMTFSKALNKCTDLIDHIRDKHTQFMKEDGGSGGLRGDGGGGNRNGLQDGGRSGPSLRDDFRRDRGSPRGNLRGGMPHGGGFHGGRRGGPGPGGPGGRSPVAPPNARPGDWPCPRCGAHNFAQRMQCFKCKCERPQGGPPRGGGGIGGGAPRVGGGFDRRDAGFDRREAGFDDRRDGDRKRPRSRSRDRHRDRRSRSRSYRGSHRGDERHRRSRDRDRRDRDRGSRSRHRDRSSDQSRDRKRSRRR